ncbi:NAD(P)-binding domain-containing protein [Bhargavaea ginsengi]|uniref:NAD(P)-binding domain-containing protein n=1 Tax=Bhargavaea ginsengi TaxID=426757 RepID=UPI002040DB81|nr:NAD(P)-binding domain-containing protein [Bhargavaea ginsengi]MCM3088661.1 NAD(P)-binding domain-containing protein [Bhargavaea ginsengi]
MKNIFGIDYRNYKYLFISTTAKHNLPLLRLPDRELSNGKSLNILISEESKAREVLQKVDGIIPTIIIDVEAKQNIDLLSIADQYVKKSAIFTNKPNDLTLEATDILLRRYFSNNLSGLNILVIGTGNIAFKLALRLAERNAQVFMEGRNPKKLKHLVDAINLVLPRHSRVTVKAFPADSYEDTLDAIIPFVSAEKVVSEELVMFLSETSLSVDGGIGNFTESYISKALEKKSSVVRLDVRIALPFTEASLNSSAPNFGFFKEVFGERVINNTKIVAGGVIGDEGTIIVDQIKSPRQIVGIANGYGGVKHESTLSREERRSIELLRQCLL